MVTQTQFGITHDVSHANADDHITNVFMPTTLSQWNTYGISSEKLIMKQALPEFRVPQFDPINIDFTPGVLSFTLPIQLTFPENFTMREWLQSGIGSDPTVTTSDEIAIASFVGVVLDFSFVINAKDDAGDLSVAAKSLSALDPTPFSHAPSGLFDAAMVNSAASEFASGLSVTYNLVISTAASTAAFDGYGQASDVIVVELPTTQGAPLITRDVTPPTEAVPAPAAVPLNNDPSDNAPATMPGAFVGSTDGSSADTAVNIGQIDFTKGFNFDFGGRFMPPPSGFAPVGNFPILLPLDPLVAQNYSGTYSEDSGPFNLDVLSGTGGVPPFTLTAVNTPTSYGVFSIIGNQVVFVPNDNYNGLVPFTFTITDTYGRTTEGTGVLDITAVNDAPVAFTDSGYTMDEDGGMSGTPLDGATVLLNDTDVDNDPLNAVLQNGPTNGSLVLNPDGTFTYTPNANFNGTDSYTYFANDGSVDSDAPTTVTITVNPVNDAPVISTLINTISGTEDTAQSIDLRDYVSDIETGNSALVFTVSNNLYGYGTAELQSDGHTVIFTPDPNYNGPATFDFTVTDTGDGSAAAITTNGTATINLAPVNDAPVADVDSYSTAEDTALNGASVLGNDTDVDGDTLNAVLQTTTTNGTLVLNSNGTFTYTPNANFNGTDSFTYFANDGTTNSGSPTTVTINVSSSNDAPVANVDSYSTAEDTGLNGASVLGNDTDLDGDTLNAVLQNTTTNGTLVLNSDGTFTYTPNANFNGTDSFTYFANDGTTNSAVPTTVTITVNAVNDAPVGNSDLYNNFSTPVPTEDTAYTIANPALGVLANDTDVDGNTLTASNPQVILGSGTVVLNADGTFTVTPAANFNGTFTWSYDLSDGTTTVPGVVVTMQFQAVNDAPIANADSYSTAEDRALNGASVLGNDTDVDGNPLTAVLQNTTTNGILVLNSDGTFTYTPNTNFNGSDSFTYFANDGTTNSGSPTTVTISVSSNNDAPVANVDSYSTAEDTALNGASVLGNDTDLDGDTLNAVLQTTTTNGTLVLNSNGTFTYTPNANFNGSDSFTYFANDGTSNSAVPTTVTITVSAVNDAPVANADSYSTSEDTGLNGASVLGNDTDVDGNPLTAVLQTTTTNGTLVLNSNGTFTYTPNANFNGTDSFTYFANDGTTNSAVPTTVTITVNAVNDAPVGNSDLYNNFDSPVPTEDTAYVVSNPALGVLANDTDVDGNTLTASNPQVILGSGTVVLNANGTFTVTPAANFNGTFTWSYDLSDGTTTVPGVVVTMQFQAVNDAPIANADSYLTAEDTALNGASVLGNDTDVDGNPLTAVLQNTTTNGILVLNSNGTFTYTPNTNFNGSDSFTYFANDGTTNSGSPTTVTINVSASNDAPVANADSYSTNEDIVLNGASVLGNDTDIDGNPLNAVLQTTTTNGTLVLNSNGTFTYTPNANFNGSDSFTYFANDGTTNSAAPTTVTITVNAVNDAPVGNSDLYNNFDTPVPTEDTAYVVSNPALGVLANDTDVDGNTLTASNPQVILGSGTVVLNANGTFTVTPAANFNGTFTWSYDLSDGTVTVPGVVVTMQFQAVNDAPVAVNDSGYSVNEDNVLNGSSVLTNDSDVELSPLNAVLATGPAHGSLTLNANGTFTYTPAANYNGTDSFTYFANDGTINSASPATVTITVNAVNDAPTLTNNGFTVNASGTQILDNTELLASDIDTTVSNLIYNVTSGPTSGTLFINGLAYNSLTNHTFTQNDINNGNVHYTQGGGVGTSDSFNFSLTDGTTTISGQTFNITVNQLPIGNSDIYAATEDTRFAVTGGSGVLTNDTDPNSDPFTAIFNSIDPGSAGKGSVALGRFDAVNGFDPTYDDGSFIMVPTDNYNGSFTWFYSATENGLPSGSRGGTAVSMTVAAVNDSPTIIDSWAFRPIGFGPSSVPLMETGLSDVETDLETLRDSRILTFMDSAYGHISGATYLFTTGFTGFTEVQYTYTDTGDGLSSPITITVISGVSAASNSADTLIGTSRDNILVGAGGGDTINGGAGSDTIYFSGSPAAVNINFSGATVTGTGGDATGDTYSNVENAWGSDFGDTFTFGSMSSVIQGLGGGDTFIAGSNVNSVITYFMDDAGVSVNLLTNTAGNSTASTSDAAGDILSGTFYNVTGGSGNDILTGNNFDNKLVGNAGNDTLIGNDGIDTLYGGAGADILQGGNGNDILIVDSSDTTVSGGAGTDKLVLTGSDIFGDTFFSGVSGIESIDLDSNGLGGDPKVQLKLTVSAGTIGSVFSGTGGVLEINGGTTNLQTTDVVALNHSVWSYSSSNSNYNFYTDGAGGTLMIDKYIVVTAF